VGLLTAHIRLKLTTTSLQLHVLLHSANVSLTEITPPPVDLRILGNCLV